eukprot:366095-Chlamydomonas_euryale.AAC.20
MVADFGGSDRHIHDCLYDEEEASTLTRTSTMMATPKTMDNVFPTDGNEGNYGRRNEIKAGADLVGPKRPFVSRGVWMAACSMSADDYLLQHLTALGLGCGACSGLALIALACSGLVVIAVVAPVLGCVCVWYYNSGRLSLR